jgi:hypothetical protein
LSTCLTGTRYLTPVPSLIQETTTQNSYKILFLMILVLETRRINISRVVYLNCFYQISHSFGVHQGFGRNEFSTSISNPSIYTYNQDYQKQISCIKKDLGLVSVSNGYQDSV